MTAAILRFLYRSREGGAEAAPRGVEAAPACPPTRSTVSTRVERGLEGEFTEIAESQPELLARHCTEAGLIEKAVRQPSNKRRASTSMNYAARATSALLRQIGGFTELSSSTPAFGRRPTTRRLSSSIIKHSTSLTCHGTTADSGPIFGVTAGERSGSSMRLTITRGAVGIATGSHMLRGRLRPDTA